MDEQAALRVAAQAVPRVTTPTAAFTTKLAAAATRRTQILTV